MCLQEILQGPPLGTSIISGVPQGASARKNTKTGGWGTDGIWAGLRAHYQWINNRAIKPNDTERQTEAGTDWRTTRHSVHVCACESRCSLPVCVRVCGGCLWGACLFRVCLCVFLYVHVCKVNLNQFVPSAV